MPAAPPPPSETLPTTSPSCRTSTRARPPSSISWLTHTSTLVVVLVTGLSPPPLQPVCASSARQASPGPATARRPYGRGLWLLVRRMRDLTTAQSPGAACSGWPPSRFLRFATTRQPSALAQQGSGLPGRAVRGRRPCRVSALAARPAPPKLFRLLLSKLFKPYAALVKVRIGEGGPVELSPAEICVSEQSTREIGVGEVYVGKICVSRFTSARFALVRSARVRLAREMLAEARFTPVRSASVRSARRRVAR